MNPIDGTELLQIVKRIEKLNEDAAAVSADLKEVYDEAKAKGYDPKYIKTCIKLLAKDPDELSEEDELLRMYRRALGI